MTVHHQRATVVRTSGPSQPRPTRWDRSFFNAPVDPGQSVCSGVKMNHKNTIEKKPEQFRRAAPFEPTSPDDEDPFFISKFEKSRFSTPFGPFPHRNLGARSAGERKFEHFHRFCVGSFSLPTWPFEAINTPLESPRREGKEEREKGRRERESLGHISSSKARCRTVKTGAEQLAAAS
jgi:hypothetical protein